MSWSRATPASGSARAAQAGPATNSAWTCPAAREHLARLGAALDWHGALSADVIAGPAGLVFIDINPRLVEPVNALDSGVDLTRALVEVARSGTSRPQPPGQPGVRTHQLLLAILGAAQHGGRRGVARELRDGLLHRGDYRDSREELTPGGGDLLAGVPVTLTALATLARPAAWRSFTSGSTGAYSLTPAAWEELRQRGRRRWPGARRAPEAGPGHAPRPVRHHDGRMPALTETEARVRAALLDVRSYDVFLDLTAGAAGPVRSRTEIRFGCREPGAATFAELTAAVTSAVLNGRAVGPAADGRLGLPGLAAENLLVVEAEVADSGAGPGLTWFTDPADSAGYLLYMGYPTQAPSVWACFDQPDLTATTTLSLALPAGWDCPEQRAGDRAAAGRAAGDVAVRAGARHADLRPDHRRRALRRGLARRRRGRGLGAHEHLAQAVAGRRGGVAGMTGSPRRHSGPWSTTSGRWACPARTPSTTSASCPG